MRIEFNRTGAERKALVKAISEITEAAAVYKFETPEALDRICEEYNRVIGNNTCYFRLN